MSTGICVICTWIQKESHFIKLHLHTCIIIIHSICIFTILKALTLQLLALQILQHTWQEVFMEPALWLCKREKDKHNPSSTGLGIQGPTHIYVFCERQYLVGSIAEVGIIANPYYQLCLHNRSSLTFRKSGQTQPWAIMQSNIH